MMNNIYIKCYIKQNLNEEKLCELKKCVEYDHYSRAVELLNSAYYLFLENDKGIKENLFTSACYEGDLGAARILYEPQIYLSGFKSATDSCQMKILKYLIIEKFLDLPKNEVEDFLEKKESNIKSTIQWMIRSQVEKAMLENYVSTSRKNKITKL